MYSIAETIYSMHSSFITLKREAEHRAVNIKRGKVYTEYKFRDFSELFVDYATKKMMFKEIK